MSSFPAHPVSPAPNFPLRVFFFTFFPKTPITHVCHIHARGGGVTFCSNSNRRGNAFYTRAFSHTWKGNSCLFWLIPHVIRSLQLPSICAGQGGREVKLIGNGPILSNRQSWSKSCQIDCLYRFSDGSFGWSDCVRLKDLGRGCFILNAWRLTEQSFAISFIKI